MYIFSSEPKVETLPESYFRDSGLGEDVLLSGPSDNEEDSIVFGSDSVADSSHQSASFVRDVVSPRAASNSRRKRKRKSSHLEAKTRQNSSGQASQVSPTEKEPVEGATAGNLSQAEPSSPADEFFCSSFSTSPLDTRNSPVPASHSSLKYPSESLATSKSSSRNKTKCSPACTRKTSKVSSPSVNQSDSSELAVTPAKETRLSLKAGSVSVVVSPDTGSASVTNKSLPVAACTQQTALESHDIITKTPNSAPTLRASGKGRKRNGSARTRLSMKFEDPADGPRLGWREGDSPGVIKAEPSSPASATIPKLAWSFRYAYE